ncbi:MAG: substrate-binding domain-containing protein [Pararhodobacter sp.]|nr:substrate-binding domain-containing protein [Pararhodobacter sp.]
MLKTFRALVLAAPLLALSLGTAAAQDRPVLGVALSSNTNPFYIAMRTGIENRAAEIGWDVRFSSVDEDVVQQVNGVMDLVAQGVDGILISPIDAVATRPAYDAAAEAGIPIMSIARHADSPNQTLYIAMDEHQIGRDIADWLIEAIGGEGQIAMISGPSGAATFRNLALGFRERAAESPEIEIVFESSGDLTRERGLNVAEDILVAHPGVRGIYGGNDELALGAAQAVGTAGLGAQVTVTGMNGVPPALAAVRRGDLGLTVELNPVAWGQLGVDTMAAYIDGQQIDQQVFIRHRLIDSGSQ